MKWLNDQVKQGVVYSGWKQIVLVAVLIVALYFTNELYDVLNHGPNVIFMKSYLDNFIPVIPPFIRFSKSSHVSFHTDGIPLDSNRQTNWDTCGYMDCFNCCFNGFCKTALHSGCRHWNSVKLCGITSVSQVCCKGKHLNRHQDP